ncbi:MAG: type II toxin-antitoxin system Phd/YefM family antitoxin [Acidimicrobiales bacterium]
MTWQLQDAKQRFSELVRRALEEGPQTVTRRGKDAVVVIAATQLDRLTAGEDDFKDFLCLAPDLDALDLRRDDVPARRVELDG